MDWLRAGWRRWRTSPTYDVLFAAIMTAITVSGSYGEGHPKNPADIIQFHGSKIPQPTVAALVLVGASTFVLMWRNRWPLAVLAVSTAGVLIYTLLGYVNGAALLAPAVAIYVVASKVSTRWALISSAIALAVLWIATAARNPFGTATGGAVVVLPVLMAAACLGGLAVANRRAFVASIQARADDEAKRRVDEERLRIARELHDVVAHTMSTINVQAAAAATVLTERPDTAAEALATIRSASKNGLRELRAILNVLRQADDADPTSPAPGLADLPVLVEGAAKAGLPVTVRTTGNPAALPAAVDLAAYRIIQESLTNAIRHAGPATATVSLGYEPECLRIEIRDTGRGDPAGMPAPAGHGLAGMRERAAAAGGELTAGPAGDSGGFTVTASLPFRREHQAGLSPAAEGSKR